LVRKIEQWYTTEDIKTIVEVCIILHNWMVTERVQRHEEEKAEWYEPATEDDKAPDKDHVDEDMDQLERQQADVALNAALYNAFTEALQKTLLHRTKHCSLFDAS
jgi:hypothetical protein